MVLTEQLEQKHREQQKLGCILHDFVFFLREVVGVVTFGRAQHALQVDELLEGVI
jgi:hypothetical protein